MKRRTHFVTLAAWLALPGLSLAGLAPAMAQFGPQVGPVEPGALMSEPDLTPGRDAPAEPVARADGYRLRGRCDVAIPIYRALANQGTGYELAEFNLGRCLLETAKKAPDPATAESMKREAGAWTLKAANRGLPNAQNAMASMYLDGEGVTANSVEAGKWSLLYHDNAARRMYGLPDIAPALQARLDAALNEKNWDDAKARAQAWSAAP
jgi:hypothetical protein